MRIFVGVMHVPGIPARDGTLLELLTRLQPWPEGNRVHVVLDPTREGPWPTARKCLEAGIAAGAEWIVVMNDDAIPCADFWTLAERALAARKHRDPVCFYTNHPKTPADHRGWVTTYDGLVGVALAVSRDNALDLLSFIDNEINKTPKTTEDDWINLWAESRGYLIHTTCPSLVEHALPEASLLGHDGHMSRTAIVPPLPNGAMLRVDWQEEPLHLGRVYSLNHVRLISDLHAPDLRHYLDIERQGAMSGRTHVFVAAPCYRGEVKAAWVESLIRETTDLGVGQIDVSIGFVSDSLVNRARNRLIADFLASDASHCLFWDTDNFPTRVGWVHELIATGHDVVGGPVVLKDGTGQRFAIGLDMPVGQQAELVNGCIEVQALGTGFMLLSRKAVETMVVKYMNETLYCAGLGPRRGRAEWALFQDCVRDGHHLSEDFAFCYRWRDLGGKVYLHPDIDFIHIGEHPYTGSFAKTYLKEAPDAAP